MITLSEALQAKSELERLQELAALAPVLQQQEDKAASEKHLEDVRKSILAENTVLYSQYQEAISEYRNELESVVSSLKHLAGTLRNVFVLRKRLVDNSQRYISAVYQHNVTHRKMDTLQSVFDSENQLNNVMPGSIVFEPAKLNDPVTGSIVNLIAHL